MHQTTGLTCLSLMYTQNIQVSGSCRQWTRDCPVSGGWRCHNSLCPTIGDSIASPIITPLAAPLARICRDTGDTAANIAQLSPGRMRYHLDTTIFQALIIIDQVWRSRYRVDVTVMGGSCNGQIIEPYSCNPFFMAYSTPKLKILVPISISSSSAFQRYPNFPILINY